MLSLRNTILVFLGLLLLQLLLATTSIELNERKSGLDLRRISHLTVEQRFLNALAREDPAEPDREMLEGVQQDFLALAGFMEKSTPELDTAVLSRRIALNIALFEQRSVQHEIHGEIEEIVPMLADSAAYIHNHHMANLRNMLDLGQQVKAEESEGFVKGSAVEGSELDKIASATSIQVNLLKVFGIFSAFRQQEGDADIGTRFGTAMDAFYTAVNLFESYSLDAQDGILVEEMIVNGSTFESYFTTLMASIRKVEELNRDLLANRLEFMENVERAAAETDTSHGLVSGRLRLAQSFTIGVGIMMMGAIVVVGYLLLAGLRETVSETRKIQGDFRYRIPDEKARFSEFGMIFTTLNHMGETVSTTIGELHDIHEELESRVAERTRELHQKHQQLKEQMRLREVQEGERRALEEKLGRAEKMEALGALAGGVAHDLNNILSAVINYPELIMLDLPEDHKLRPSLQKIQDSGKKAALIVQDLLTMARRGVASQEVVDFNRLVRDFLGSPECEAILSAHPDIELVVRLDESGGCIRGSRIHLQKVLMNLLANAAESITAEGVVTLESAMTYVDSPVGNYDHVQEGEYITFTIRDTGIGIAAAELEKIFEPFYSTKSLGRSGSGLGMAVVWGTVKDHGGYIDIVSKQAVGTTFTLYFPRVREEREFAADTSVIEAVGGNGETVLVVDDVAEQRDIAALMLTRLGYAVHTVSSGEAAINHLRHGRADILLLDMIMTPGIDGLETYRQIIKRHPGQKALIVSGFSENEKVAEAQRLGTGAFVNKPYSLEVIGAAVRNELDRRG